MSGLVDSMKRSRAEYLDQAAASEPGRDYKQKMLEAMSLLPRQTVIDIGCGAGTDLAQIADRVGGDGVVIGIDADPVMVVEARRRLRACSNVEVRDGDAHVLPLADVSVDRVRMDRVVQHLADPARAFAEVRRVIRPGGLFVVAEPDWDTLVIDDSDVETSRAYARFVATQVVRNGSIGRQLARLAIEAGFDVCSVVAAPVLFTDFEVGDTILRVGTVMDGAVKAGAVDAEAAGYWLSRIRSGPFLAAFTFFMIVAERPA